MSETDAVFVSEERDMSPRIMGSAWELMQRHDGGKGAWPCGTEWDAPRVLGKQGRLAAIYVGPKATAVRVTVAECKATWSRELKRRVREAELSRRLPCETQVAGEYEGVEVEDLSGLMDPFGRVWR